MQVWRVVLQNQNPQSREIEYEAKQVEADGSSDETDDGAATAAATATTSANWDGETATDGKSKSTDGTANDVLGTAAKSDTINTRQANAAASGSAAAPADVTAAASADGAAAADASANVSAAEATAADMEQRATGRGHGAGGPDRVQRPALPVPPIVGHRKPNKTRLANTSGVAAGAAVSSAYPQGGKPAEFYTLPNDKYDAPEEVCGERKLFDRPLK